MQKCIFSNRAYWLRIDDETHQNTKQRANTHNKNDREPPTQRTNHPLLASDQSETLAEPVLCSQARNALARREREVIFNTDSAWVGVDNRCSGCISHVATNFIGELVESDVAIEGFSGSITRKVMKGTLRWKWTDDDGRTHKFLIPDSFYVPHGGARLLSPQHWAQTQKDRKPTFGTGEWTDAEKCVLYCDQKWYKKTIYLDTGRSNVATMRLAPGYHAFKAFCAEAEVDDIFGYDFNPLRQLKSATTMNPSLTHTTTSTARRDGPPTNRNPPITMYGTQRSQGRLIWREKHPHPRIPLSLLMRRINPGTKLRPRSYCSNTTGSGTSDSQSCSSWRSLGYSQNAWRNATSHCVRHACMPRPPKGPGKQKPKTSNIPIRTPPPPATSFQWTKWNHQSLAW